MGDPYSMTQILWSTDPTTQHAIWIVLGSALVSAVLIFIPLVVRLVRLFVFERRLRSTIEYAETMPPAKTSKQATLARRNHGHEELRDLFVHSPIRTTYEEFERRWKTAQLADGIDRAPIRMMDVFDERPLLPYGPRRSLLPVLPGVFLGLGVFAALFGVIPSLSSLAVDSLSDDARSTWMVTQLGLALRASTWGFICAITASLSSRLIEGAYHARSHRLDELVENAFGSVSPGELAEITRQTQQKSLDTLGKELSGFANELNERLDRGLQRIEQSTARAANLVSQEQRGALHNVVQELSLSVRQGVEHHLGELRGALQRAVEHQSSVTGGLAETFERMVENSHTQDRVARTLADTATSVEEAANAMRGSATEMRPILEHLSATSRGLADTAERIGDTQKIVARTAEGVRSSLEHAATGVDDQRQFIELSLGEIRRVVVGLSDGLGGSLQRALREVDDALSGTVGQLRKTLAESNETIERLAGPIRGAEGSTRETHVALDRVRGEVEALGQWMAQAVKPLREGLTDVAGRAEEISRAMIDFTSNTRQMDKTMEALREEIHEESRRLQGTGSELSRRLTLASDAVGQLETATADATRHPRGTTPLGNGTPYSASARGLSQDAADAAGGSGHRSNAESKSEPGSSFENPRRGVRSEPTQSGYRVGASRARGPDPYSRLEGGRESTSNLRHFPTPDRELGDNLKLSGLMRPSTGESRNAPHDKESSSAARSNDTTKSNDDRDDSARSSDESE